MRFALDTEQLAFADSVDALLRDADVPAAARAWAGGDPSAGRKLWQRLADLGVQALRVPEAHGGLAAGAVDLVAAFEPLGYHAVPGPYVESVAAAPALLSEVDRNGTLAGIAEGARIATLAAPPHTPLALDADVADRVLLLDGERLHDAAAGRPHRSVDPARRLWSVTTGEPQGELGAATAAAARDAATLACCAQLLGCGERLLDESVGYAKQREQFGHPIGEYQALKHAMADVRVALDFARPLVHAAAMAVDEESDTAARDVSAAKIATADAAYLASRTALQVHGAIGYTAEYDLHRWITKVRALVGVWGTSAFHRDRVLAAIT